MTDKYPNFAFSLYALSYIFLLLFFYVIFVIKKIKNKKHIYLYIKHTSDTSKNLDFLTIHIVIMTTPFVIVSFSYIRRQFLQTRGACASPKNCHFFTHQIKNMTKNHPNTPIFPTRSPGAHGGTIASARQGVDETKATRPGASKIIIQFIRKVIGS